MPVIGNKMCVSTSANFFVLNQTNKTTFNLFTFNNNLAGDELLLWATFYARKIYEI